VAGPRLDDDFEGFFEVHWSDVVKEITVICGYRGTLITLAARTPLDLHLEVVAAGLTANISGQAHIVWHVFFQK
jgi:hypothetical protein